MLTQQEFTTLLNKKVLAFPKRHQEHFGKVLRRNKSWPALVCDGRGTLTKALVSGDEIQLTQETPIVAKRRRTKVRLVQAWVKSKALSLILQKAAELGAEEIIMVTTERSGFASEKTERMEAILENACMQAYNPYKPTLAVRSFTDAANFAQAAAYYGDLEATTPLYKACPEQIGSIAFFNGPEGGFSTAERDYLHAHACGVLLSENVLRSETAAIIALGYFCQLL